MFEVILALALATLCVLNIFYLLNTSNQWLHKQIKKQHELSLCLDTCEAVNSHACKKKCLD